MSVKSKAEELLAFHLRAAGLRAIREFHFHPTRKWRADFAFPAESLLIEVEGVTRYGKNKDGSMRLGRHQTAKGFTEDLVKYNAAALLGFRVLRFSPDMVKSGTALQDIERALATGESA